MMTSEIKKSRVKKYNEFWVMLMVNSFFTFVLILVNIIYSDWPGTFSSPASSIAGVVLLVIHIVSILLWIVTVNNWTDPNQDKFRWRLLICLIVCIIGVCSFRAYKNELNGVLDDSNKAKQEEAQ